MLNRNVGKYHLSHLWDRFLFNTPGLKIDSAQDSLYKHNNGLAQTILANSQSPITTGAHSLCLKMPSNTYNHINAKLFSDLMKITVVIESLSNVLSKRKTLPNYSNTTE